MRKIVLYIAVSLDGFVADINGSVHWLEGQDSDSLEAGGYSEFIETVDTVIMGYRTYHQIVTELSPDDWPYTGIHSYVLTHRSIPFPAESEITFTDHDIQSLMQQLQKEPGKDIWICGGADLVNQLVKLNMIDRYHITVIPTILGNGIRLFKEDNPEIKLKLMSTLNYNGMTDLIFEKR